MTTIEDLESRLKLLEDKYKNHMHNGFNGLTTPKYNYWCPRCESLNKPVNKGSGDNWYCPDCGRKYERDDFECWFAGVPTMMPMKQTGD